MPFTTEPTISPTAIGDILVRMWTDGVGGESVMYNVEVENDQGGSHHRTGDLGPHLAPAEIAALRDFLAMLRAKAEAEFLP